MSMKGSILGVAISILILGLLALVWRPPGAAQGIGQRLAEIQARTVGSSDEGPVVATVNGKPIFLHVIEASAATARLMRPELDEQMAFKVALAKTILNTALYQQARKAGIDVSREEAEEVYQRMKQVGQGHPVAKDYFETVQKMPPEQRRQVTDVLIEGYRQAMAVSRWENQMAQKAVPRPSDEEVRAYLQAHPQEFRNVLALSTLYFTDEATANEVYASLRKAAEQGPQAVDALFREAAQKYNPERTSTVEVFTFLVPAELPDYARDALQYNQGAVHLFRRSDGTFVIYRVDRVIYVPEDRIYEQVRERIWQERKRVFVNQLQQRVLQEADIHIYEDNLPDGIRLSKQEILRLALSR